MRQSDTKNQSQAKTEALEHPPCEGGRHDAKKPTAYPYKKRPCLRGERANLLRDLGALKRGHRQPHVATNSNEDLQTVQRIQQAHGRIHLWHCNKPKHNATI